MKKYFFIVFINFFIANNSYSLIEVDITRGNLDPLPIAVSPLHVDPTSENTEEVKIKELGDNVEIKVPNGIMKFEVTQVTR